MSNNQTMWAAATSAAVAALCTFSAAGDDALAFLSDGRSLNAMTNVQQCTEQGVVGASQAPDAFEPFVRSINANQSCPGSEAIASASQNSHFGDASMSAAGTALGAASSETFGVIHAIPRSRFEVTFELTQTRRLALSGTLLAVGDDGIPVIDAYASVRIWQPGGAIIFERTHTTATPGQITLDELFTLEPGVYAVRSEASILIDGVVPPAASSGAAFDLDFDIAPPLQGDLNNDGVVDVSDLLLLLAAWGACPRGLECPADLNADGAVDVSDLLILLANWG